MTSSSAASLPYALEASEKEFGIEKNFSSFGLPLGMVMFMPGGVIYLMLSTVFFANQFGVSISPAWLVSAAILAALLAIAAPPIPGAAVVIFTMLFSKLGIPTDALAIVFSVDVLFDFLATAANMYTLPLEMVHVAAKKTRLDIDAFRK
jgi:Na+/H+-dicarboxylate symporters